MPWRGSSSILGFVAPKFPEGFSLLLLWSVRVMPISLPADLPLSSEAWERTLPAVQALIVALWEEVQALRVKVGELAERVGQHSQNSSRPPSSDPPGAPKRERKVSGRKAGGQPGHRGEGRKLLPVEEVDEVVEVKPEVCWRCGICFVGAILIRHDTR